MLIWAPLQRTFIFSIRASVPTPQTGSYRHSFSHLQRAYASSNVNNDTHTEVTNVAVLGGGITGLASAYYIAQQLPHSKITLFEGSSRLGGWLHSKQVSVGDGKVVFEQGPRNLRPTRPNGWVTLSLVSMQGTRSHR